jgi:hypothetical protein
MSDELDSTPPDAPLSLRRFPQRQPESLLPPRTWPGLFGVAASSIAGAAAVANNIDDPRYRAGLLLLCGLGAWLVGYVTPPPRRRFRRGDDR